MGRRGPAPTPAKLRVLRGNPGRRPIPDAPEPTGTPERPAGMSDAAVAVWDRIIRDYGSTGVLTGVDVDAVRIYCEAVVRYEHAAQLLEQSGPLVKGARHAGDLVRNPLHQIVRDNADLVRAFARELGFTPSARSALSDVKDKSGTDPLAEWAANG